MSSKYIYSQLKNCPAPPPPSPPIRNSKLHMHCYLAGVLANNGKKAKYPAELLALGGLTSLVCTCRRVDCNSVIGTDNGVVATSGIG